MPILNIFGALENNKFAISLFTLFLTYQLETDLTKEAKYCLNIWSALPCDHDVRKYKKRILVLQLIVLARMTAFTVSSPFSNGYI